MYTLVTPAIHRPTKIEQPFLHSVIEKSGLLDLNRDKTNSAKHHVMIYIGGVSLSGGKIEFFTFLDRSN